MFSIRLEPLALDHAATERRGPLLELAGKIVFAQSSSNHRDLLQHWQAFLTPDLVEAVLRGRQPAQLTLRQVMKQLPWDWNEQRRCAGSVVGALV